MLIRKKNREHNNGIRDVAGILSWGGELWTLWPVVHTRGF